MFQEKPANNQSRSSRKPIYGVGINDADYIIDYKDSSGNRLKCPFYRKWLNMLCRCYSDKLHSSRPNYKDCSVCSEWLIFTNFKSWMINQDWEGKVLDKDIKIKGNKIYSPNSCLFISEAVNSLLSDRATMRGAYPKGVSWNKRRNIFVANCAVNGELVYLGHYNTAEDASKAYINFKNKEIERQAKLNPEIAKYLLQHREDIS